MVHCKRLLRPLFYINSIAGLSTVCPDTWEKSNGRRGYACFWLVIHIVELVLYVQQYLYTDEITGFQIFTVTANGAFLCFLLLQSICDHKTVLAAALSLEAIRDRTEAEGVPTVPVNIGYFIYIFMEVITLASAVLNSVNTWLLYENVKIFTNYLISAHYIALQSAHAFSYLTLMFVVLQAEESINNALRQGFENESREEFISMCDFRRAKLLKFVREMKGALSHVKDDLHEYFKMFLTYRVFLACTIMPKLIHFVAFEQGMSSDHFKNGELVSSVVIISLFIVIVLYVHSRIAATGPEFQTTLYEYCLSLQSQDQKREFRHLTLACLHRRHTPTCWIFDLEFGLIMTLLDISLLVFLSISGFTKADN